MDQELPNPGARRGSGCVFALDGTRYTHIICHFEHSDDGGASGIQAAQRSGVAVVVGGAIGLPDVAGPGV